MSDYNFTKADIINANERFNVGGKGKILKVDEAVSKVVGRKVFINNPKLIKLVAKWKGNKPENSTEPDNFLKDPEKVKELKAELS